MVVADEEGVRWSAIRSAAQAIKYVEQNSPNGTNNFDFAAVAMVPPNVPFFPSSNHNGAGHEFSVGWEAGAFVADVLAGANRDASGERATLPSVRAASACGGRNRKMRCQVRKKARFDGGKSCP